MKATSQFLYLFAILSQNILGQSAWEKVDTDLNKPLRYIFFLNEIIGWGYSSVYNASTWQYDCEIHKTTNGGVNWVTTSIPEGMNKFYFVSQDSGWGIGSNTVYKSTNSGKEWKLKLSVDSYIYKLFYLNSNICWVLCADKQGIFKTTDGGNTWEEYPLNVQSRDIVDFYFINENIGFSCYQGIYKTVDGGKTWIRKMNPLSYGDFHCIQFVNDSVGWAAGHAIYKTVDSGETWILQKKLGTFNDGYSATTCYFFNENKGLIDLKFITLNGGETWEAYNINVDSSCWLDYVDFINDSIGYAIYKCTSFNDGGILYKTTTGGIITSIYNNYDIPDFTLNRNYPNPFNSLTTLKYNLQKSSNVILKIYNLSGQKIETLVNEFQAAGEHEISWQPKGLPAGIYFYRFQAGEYTETKKLILQK